MHRRTLSRSLQQGRGLWAAPRPAPPATLAMAAPIRSGDRARRQVMTQATLHRSPPAPRTLSRCPPDGRHAPFATNPAVDASASSSSDSASPPPPPMFEDPREEILAAALKLVPSHGWSDEALAGGAAALGFPAVAHGMFGRGAIELVEHAVAQIDAAWLAELDARKAELAALPSSRKRLDLAIQLRLKRIVPYLPQWPQALALGLVPQNLETTARGLAHVADELCVAAGDEAVDLTNWYAHRSTVCCVYVATELFFLTDYSEDHRDTWAFLERRLRDVEALSHAPQNVQEGVLAFQTAASAVASAVASLAQPAVWGAIQQVPVTGTMVTVLQTALANLAAMAPATATPFRDTREGTGKEAQETTEFSAPLEQDPYATGKEGAGGKKGN